MTENTLIFERSFDQPVAVQKTADDVVQIGDLVISYRHNQDCCESVYADFSVFDSLIKDLGSTTKIEIKAVEDSGILFFFYDGSSSYGDPRRIGVLVNCYNSQNGYYSSDLYLTIRNGDVKTEIDVSAVVYDVIC
jgi:hypothetical protein